MEKILLVFGYLKQAVLDNFATKFVVGIFTSYISMVYVGNEELFKIIITLFIIDWILGSIKALQHRVFNSKGFLRGVFKLIAYGILLYIGFALDATMPFEIFLGLIFSFIAITDISSILENLDSMGVEVPIWLRKFLSIHKDKFFTDKIKQITGYDVKTPYLDDLKQIEKYIDNIPNKDKRDLFKIKIVYLRRIVMTLIDMRACSNLKTLKVKIDILFKNTGSELERAVFESGKDKASIDSFWKSHTERFYQLVDEINLIIDDNKDKENSKEQLRQIKENIIQTIIRIIYKNVADKF